MKNKSIEGVIFEWDDEKNKSNEKKHGILFEDAAMALLDEGRVELYDETHSIWEDRYIVIGMANKVLFVVYTVRDGANRMISARLANKEEQRLYYGNNESNS